MIDALTKDDVRNLAEIEARYAVTLYLPTHQGGRDIREDPIRLRNQLGVAAETLAEAGIPAERIDAQLAPARNLIRNGSFWKQQSDGLALFLDPTAHRIFRLPHAFPDVTVVGPALHIRPLLHDADDSEEFHLLSVSRRHAALHRASRYEIQPVALDSESLPAPSIPADETEGQLQHHTIPGPAGDHTAVFHGQGGTERPAKEQTLRFLRHIDRQVMRVLETSSAPLVFAGDGALHALYREVNRYPALLDGFVSGNPDRRPLDAIHKEAWTLISARIDQQRRAAIDAVREPLGAGKGVTDLESVVRNSIHGRVQLLLFAEGRSAWGQYDIERDAIRRAPEPRTDCEDLLNLAARHAIRHGAGVFSLPENELPDGAIAAAALRY